MGVAAEGVVGSIFGRAIDLPVSCKPPGKRNGMGRPAIAGESPVRGSQVADGSMPEYRRTRAIRWESGGTTLQG